MNKLIKQIVAILLNPPNKSEVGFSIVKNKNNNNLVIQESFNKELSKIDIISNINNNLVKFRFFEDTNDNRLEDILLAIVRSKVNKENKNKLLTTFFQDIQFFKLSKYLDVLKVDSIRRKDKENFKEYAFYLLAMPKDKYNGGTLKHILESLNYYSYCEKDYNNLLKLFHIYEQEIKYNLYSNEREWFFKFLRENINKKDWNIFLDVHKMKHEHVVKYMSEEVVGNMMLLKFNPFFIINMFPKFSLGEDINIAINKLVLIINNHAYRIGVTSVKVVENYKNNIELLFIFKNQVERAYLEKISIGILDCIVLEEEPMEDLIVKIIEVKKLDFLLPDKKSNSSKINKV